MLSQSLLVRLSWSNLKNSVPLVETPTIHHLLWKIRDVGLQPVLKFFIVVSNIQPDPLPPVTLSVPAIQQLATRKGAHKVHFHREYCLKPPVKVDPTQYQV